MLSAWGDSGEMGPGTCGPGEKFAGPSICVVRELSALASDACIHGLLWPSGDNCAVVYSQLGFL